MLLGKCVSNTYMLDIHHASCSVECLLTKEKYFWLWHRRIHYIHMHNLNKLVSWNLDNRLPKLKFVKDNICEACQKGK